MGWTDGPNPKMMASTTDTQTANPERLTLIMKASCENRLFLFQDHKCNPHAHWPQSNSRHVMNFYHTASATKFASNICHAYPRNSAINLPSCCSRWRLSNDVYFQ